MMKSNKSPLKVTHRANNFSNDKQSGGPMFVLPDELCEDDAKAKQAMVEALKQNK